jgi:hypothetical protein
VRARKWFQKTYGNTYHSVRIFVNGEKIGENLFSYGYGEQYKDTALKILVDTGIVPENILKMASYEIREKYNISWDVMDVKTKKEL